MLKACHLSPLSILRQIAPGTSLNAGALPLNCRLGLILRLTRAVMPSLVLMFALAISNAHAVSLCSPLKRLLVHADSDFQQLRGYFDPRLRTWVATYRMPGAYGCTIDDFEQMPTYSCKWMHDEKSGPASEAYSDIVHSLSRCLNISGSTEHDDGEGRHSTQFRISGSRKAVIVEQNESGSGDYTLRVKVLPLVLQ